MIVDAFGDIDPETAAVLALAHDLVRHAEDVCFGAGYSSEDMPQRVEQASQILDLKRGMAGEG